MATVTGATIIKWARERLQDKSNVVERWSDSVLIDGINEAQLALVDLKRDASTATTVVDISGKVHHDLPAEALSLIKVTRNMGEDGNTPGRVVTRTYEEILQAVDPNWSMTVGPEVDHFLFDERDEKRFSTYPLVEVGHVELVMSVVPQPLASPDDTISVDDTYAPALLTYTCFAVLSSDMANPANRDLANIYHNQFIAQVMGKEQGEGATNPNANRRVS